MSDNLENSAEPPRHSPLDYLTDPPELEGLSDAAAVAAIKEWWHENFETPENETPRQEGEYYYAWGGPYDASNIVPDLFSDVVSEQLINAAIDQIEAEGILEWAPRAHIQERPDDDFYEPADDPRSVATGALEQLDEMVGSQSPYNDPQFTNRLIFAGAVSCLEAYLGDTLVNAVRDEPKVRAALLGKHKELGNLTISAAELAADPEAMTKRVVQKLKGVLYHNLRAVTALYRAAFGVDLMPSKGERDLLFPAMEQRHHCVHRNGYNEEGVRLIVFTDDYVRAVIAAVVRVVDHVERERLKDLPF